MKRIVMAIGVCGAMIASSGCGDVPSGDVVTDRAPLIGGEEDLSDHPYVGTLVMPFPGRVDPPFARCSGTLIAPDLFLTAGHCGARIRDWGLAREEWGVMFEPVYVSGATLRHGTVYLHPSYGGPGVNDVAMIVLEEPVDAITPARIAPNRALEKSAEELAQAEFVIVGYGATDRAPQAWPGRGTRRAATVRFLELLGGSEYGVEPDLWATFGGTGATAGNGDSGGPVLLGDSVHGVIWGYLGSAPNTAATRLDTSSIRRFANSFLEGESYDVRQDL